jgi:hypothetical protein
MHLKWKSCLATRHGKFRRHEKDTTIILVAVDGKETWIWQASLGMHGSCNDINLLQQPHHFAKLSNVESPPVMFQKDVPITWDVTLWMTSIRRGQHF